MKSVTHIFGGEAKVKIMRLFVFNPSQVFATQDVALRTKEKPAKVRREIRELSKAGLLKPRVKRGARGYTLNDAYPYL
jgi:Fic family protein